MGQHYVPQQYLVAFATPDDPSLIWVYDKQKLSCKRLPIKNVAQARQFYKAEVEAELSSRLEGPANVILERLRNRESITEEQRIHFAIYTVTMMKRVPRRRRIAREDVLPKAIEHTVEQMLTELKTWAATKSDRELVVKRIAEVERLREEFHKEPPRETTDQIDSPWPTWGMIESIASMTWRLASTKGPQFFITSDNPAFFFEAFGIGRPESEMSFSLSPDLALLLDRKGEPGAILPVDVKQSVVREVNRRQVASAERLIFCREQQAWLLAAMGKPRPYLSRIGWGRSTD